MLRVAGASLTKMATVANTPIVVILGATGAGKSQLALVDAASSKITPVGKPGLYEELGVAPDGRHAVVTDIRPPYSYVTTFDRFPKQIDLWDLRRSTWPQRPND